MLTVPGALQTPTRRTVLGTGAAIAAALFGFGWRRTVDAVAACGNCHTPRGPNGPRIDRYLAGGEHIKHKDFSAVSSNITPDPETGLALIDIG